MQAEDDQWADGPDGAQDDEAALEATSWGPKSNVVLQGRREALCEVELLLSQRWPQEAAMFNSISVPQVV